MAFTKPILDKTVGDLTSFFRGGLNLFGDLKENWSNLSKYFRKISSIISHTLNNQLNIAAQKANLVVQKLTKRIELTPLKLKNMKQAIKIIQELTNFVSIIAIAYAILSENHLQPMLSELGKFIALDPELQNDAWEELELKVNLANKSIDENQERMENKFNEIGSKSLSYLIE